MGLFDSVLGRQEANMTKYAVKASRGSLELDIGIIKVQRDIM